MTAIRYPVIKTPKGLNIIFYITFQIPPDPEVNKTGLARFQRAP